MYYLKIPLQNNHVNINNMVLNEKHNYILNDKLTENSLFYIIVNLFNVWPNRRKLASHICFCIHDDLLCCFGLKYTKKTQPHTDA